MRSSNRTLILDAAVRVVERDGLTAVTFDSVAAESRLTRGGLMYHFPSREALINAIHQHLADQWEAGLAASAGRPAEEATSDERDVAYIRVCVNRASRAQLQLLLEATRDPGNMAPWNAVLERWGTRPPEDLTDERVLDRFIARLAADGLWAYESLSNQRLPPAMRARIAEQIAHRVTQTTEPR